MKKHKPLDDKGEIYEELLKVQKELGETSDALRTLQFRFDDIVEMHQKEMSALKQEFSLLEEKISYYIAMKLQDFDDKIQDSNALIATLERQLFLWTSFDHRERPQLMAKTANTILAFISVIMILIGMIINMASPIFASRRNYMLFIVVSAIALYMWYQPQPTEK